MQIGLRWCLVDGKDGVDDIGSQLFGERAVELRGQGCAGNGKKKLSVNFLLELKLIEELPFCQSLLYCV